MAVLVIAACTGLLVWLRLNDARHFSRAYHVQTYSGTNYVFQFSETTVGKTETGCVLIVSMRLENPNPVALTLKRDWFVLVDDDKDYYQPVVTSEQTATITVPANGVAEKEALNFVVPDDALKGVLALSIGHQYFVMFKSNQPFRRQLSPGQFVTFRQLNW